MAVTTVDLGSVKGPQGTRGSRWSQGTAITGTSTTATVFSGTGITDALINDNYLNTSTGNTYRCTVAGAASVAKWVYTGNLRGATGATGPQGATGPKGDNATAAQVSYNKSGTSTTVQAELDTLNGSLTGVIVPNSQFTVAQGYTNNCRLVKIGNMMSLTMDVQGNYPANTLISPIIIPAAYRPKKNIISTCSNGANVPVVGTLSIKTDGSVNAYMPSLSAAIFGNYSWTI